jgi:hypothetical protein
MRPRLQLPIETGGETDVALDDLSDRPQGAFPASRALLWAGCLVGLPIMQLSFHVAASDTAGAAKYGLFWTGLLLALVPAMLLVFGRQGSAADRRTGLLASVAILTLPKLLLNIGGPLYHDEFPHWREVQAIVESGHLFRPVSIVPIVASFPGLHGLTASVALLGGVGTWTGGLVVVVAAHALTVLGVYVFATRVTGSDRSGAIAAFIYALNPSYMYFDAQFSYESLAICFFVWALAFAVEIGPESTWRPAALTAVMCVACFTTHHLTTVVLVFVLLLLAILRTVAWRGGDPGRVALAFWALAALTAIGFGVWVTIVAPDTYNYLSPYVGRSLGQLFNMGAGEGASRTLYSNSTVPAYERWAAFAAQPLLLFAALAALRQMLKQRHLDATRLALSGLGLLYFVSLPFILTTAGAEGARRSWAFSYLGLALLVAPWVESVVQRRDGMRLTGRWVAAAAVTAFCAVVLVGNISSGVNASYRFPGPFQFGSDTRTTTTESIDVALWLKHSAGAGARVVTDSYTELALASYGGAHVAFASPGFPVWDLYTTSTMPPARLLEQLRTSDFQYLVIDKRLARVVSDSSTYFDSSEPNFRRRPPFTQAALSKFDDLPWTVKVYESNSYAVYRFDFRALPTPAPSPSPTVRR